MNDLNFYSAELNSLENAIDKILNEIYEKRNEEFKDALAFYPLKHYIIPNVIYVEIYEASPGNKLIAEYVYKRLKDLGYNTENIVIKTDW